MIVVSSSQEETEEIGRRIAPLLTEGSFVALSGDLGGGKTCFVRGIVKGFSPDCAHLVASPSFAIMNEYAGPITVYHFDMYRLSGASDISELGFDDIFHGNGISIVEWSERLEGALPEDRLSIHFEYAGENQRSISFRAFGVDAENMIRQLKPLLETA